MANPVNDMYADAVLAVILQVESNPTAAQGDYFTSIKPRLIKFLSKISHLPQRLFCTRLRRVMYVACYSGTHVRII